MVTNHLERWRFVMWRVGVRVTWLAVFVAVACLGQILVWFGEKLR